MGITGLLPFLKNSCRSANVRDFQGATVAIDAYSWLHKGAFSCADKLVKGEKTDGYVFYCVKLLNMLLDAGVKPIMVFDGCNLSSKEVTEKKRRENREKTRQRGKELLCEGNVREARECFQRCVDVTPEMAREVIEMCRKKSIDCIVAPYEADAQLAYLNMTGMAQIIITEDSDLVLFGCEKILFKMDNFGGGLLYEKENLPKSFGANALKFSFEKFRYMCILSGCDYLPSLPGIGLAKACKFFTLTTNNDILSVLSKLPSYLKMPKLTVSESYKEAFMKANNTFLYQLVFCPKKKTLVPLNPYPEGYHADDMEYAGKYLPDDLAYELAMGNINVKTLKKFEISSSFSTEVNEDKSAIWSTKEESNENKDSSKKKKSAFKFTSVKVKSLPVKRKHEERGTDDDKNIPLIDEDLLSMYGGYKACSKTELETSDEDPLAAFVQKKQKLSLTPPKDSPAACKNISNLTFHRVVKSRFFKESKPVDIQAVLNEFPSTSAEKKDSESSDVEHNSSISSDTSPAEKDKMMLENNISCSFDLVSPKKDNKENIIHRFAKKKVTDDKPESTLNTLSFDVDFKPTNASTQEVKKSWLDVIDSESSVTTSTNAATNKPSEILCENSKSFKDNINRFNSNFKSKKLKLISTKILDFKWTSKSESKNKLDSSLNSVGNSSFESAPDDEDNKLLLEESSYFPSVNDSSDCNTSICSVSNNMELSSNHEDSAYPAVNIADSVILSKSSIIVKPKQLGVQIPGKTAKCLKIGLSKKQKVKDQKILRKETLLNFNFIRKPRTEVEILS